MTVLEVHSRLAVKRKYVSVCRCHGTERKWKLKECKRTIPILLSSYFMFQINMSSLAFPKRKTPPPYMPIYETVTLSSVNFNKNY